MSLPSLIAKVKSSLVVTFTSRRAVAAAPVVAIALVVGVAMASNRTDPAKVETREDVPASTPRIVSTSEGMSDAATDKAKDEAKAKAKAKVKKEAEDKAKADAKADAKAGASPTGTGAPEGTAKAELAEAAPPPPPPPPPPQADPTELRPPELGVATAPDPSAGLVGDVPPVAWPEGCRCAPLTGLGVDSDFGVGGPTLAVKVSNAPSANPQTGLNLADLIYEEPAHKITDASRFLAIFHSRNVDHIGPVRSARTGDLPLLAPLNRPILAYAGANDMTQMFVELREKAGWLVHARENKDGGPQFFRNSPGVTETNLFVSRNNLVQKYTGLAGAPNEQFAFLGDGQQNANAKPAGRVDLQVAGQRSGFIWQDASKQWVRFQSGRPHVNAADGSQIGRSSVIVLTTAYQGSFADMNSLEAVTFPMPGRPASGQAWVLTGNTVTQGTWSRGADTSLFSLRDLNGGAIGLQRGPIYVGLVSTAPTIS